MPGARTAGTAPFVTAPVHDASDMVVARSPTKNVLLNPSVKSIYEFNYEDFTLENYDPHPAIKAPIAV